MIIDLEIIVGLAWKSAVIAGLGLFLLQLTRRRSSAQRSLLAHAALLAVAALPFAALLLPAWSPLPGEAYSTIAAIPAPAAEHYAPASTAPDLGGAATGVSAGLSGAALALMLYLAPALLLLAALATSVGRLFAMRRRAVVLVDASWLAALARAQRRMGFKHGTALLVSEELRSPISWGVLRPTIVLDPAAVAGAGEAEAIIAHELAHVARLDWSKLLLARMACALFWFNPLIWILARESHQLREEAADDAVLLSNVEGTDYAALLVNAARHDNAALLLAAHGVAPGRGSLKRRISRVLDRRLSRAPAGAGWAALCLGALLGLAGPLAAFGPERIAEAEAAPLTAPIIADVSPAVGDDPSLAAAPPATPLPAAPTLDGSVGLRAAGAIPGDPGPPRTSTGMPGLREPDVVAAGTVREGGDPIERLRVRPDPASLDDVVAARVVGMDPAYVDRMGVVFPGVALRDLVGAQAVGVTADYAGSMRARFPHAGLRDVMRMRAVGVSEGHAGRTGRAAGSSSTELRSSTGLIRAEAGADGNAVARLTRGGRIITVDTADEDGADHEEPHEPPTPPRRR